MLRFGVIGTNWITEAFMEAALETGEAQFTGVYSRTEERAQAFATKHGIIGRYTSLEAFAQSREFEAVYIASPNARHAEQAIACMRQGKHVLCEKPMASNSAELEAMIAAAEQNGVLLMEALKTTLLPNFEAIRAGLADIGRVRRYMASFGQYSSRYDAYRQGTVLNAFNPELSNGALMDLGVYCVYPLAVLFGRPDRIQANAVLLESGVDGEGSLLLRYPDMEAVLMYSKITSSYASSEIQGEDGTLVIDKISQQGRVELRHRDGTVLDLSRPQAANTMVYEAKEFIHAVKEGRRQASVNTHEHSRIAMAIMDEARRQMRLVFPADLSREDGGGQR